VENNGLQDRRNSERRISSPVAGKITATILSLVLLSTLACGTSPAGKDGSRSPDLVDLSGLHPGLKFDVRYARSDNFLGRPVYPEARVFLQRPAAEALIRAHEALALQGFGLLIFDGYRPWSVTKIFWDATPADKKAFVADPRTGSRHNRGCAVDLTLYDLRTGREAEMPSAFDEMSERSGIAFSGGSPESRRLRDRLRMAMEAQGFAVYEPEWWHYDYKDWKEYPILDIPFRAIGR
jgi:zinc D-Ala-D-Ala dipeptidase